jgi:enediyne core biosynthesis thioesterase
MLRSFEYHHVVTFDETNVVGNVYFTSHLHWQGRCRELFLREHVPQIVDALGEDLTLATTRCDMEYLAELYVFDEIVVRMWLGELVQNRITLRFEYERRSGDHAELVATGSQQVACMGRRNGALQAVPVPQPLVNALKPYHTVPSRVMTTAVP